MWVFFFKFSECCLIYIFSHNLKLREHVTISDLKAAGKTE